MFYTMKDISSLYNLSQHTIRYYDKEGLLPFVKRDASGNRVFSETDKDIISIICTLKDTGMSIKDIKGFVDACQNGVTTEMRLALINHRDNIVNQIKILNDGLRFIDDVLIESSQLQ